jgi:ATP-binding cassette subfamily B protein
MGIVCQEPVLFNDTVYNNITFGVDTTQPAPNGLSWPEAVEQAARIANAHEFISQMPEGYNTYIEQGGTNVSGGQKQRLCIARALLKKPKILILDDSTSAVDMKTDAYIRRGFYEYIPDTTKIIIAQRVASVMECDMIVIMDGGRIVDTDAHDELLKRCDIYREIYEEQTKGGKHHV